MPIWGHHGRVSLAPSDSAPVSRMLGRDDDLAALLAHLGIGAPLGGPVPGRAALVAGDAGMGKTTLLAALCAHGRAQGWRVLVGHCLDLADLLLPYLPFTEIVGRLADEHPEVAREAAARHPAIAALAPGRRLLQDKAGHPRVERADLFEAVHATLEVLADQSPVLVVVEDLHWADQSTRDLMSFLFARPFRGRVAVVGSYRGDELHRRHPLRAAVAEWARLPGIRWTQLGPLPDDVVRRLVRVLHPGPIRERDVGAIVDRADGNAFFVEELVNATQSGAQGAGLPESLADLLLVRLDRLDEASRVVVRAASCSGRRVTHALLAAVLDLTGEALDQALRTAVEGNVLAPSGADGYAFRHALLSEAVHDDLLPGERVRLHGRYVQAIAGQVVPGTAAELATHARAAYDTETAIRASIRAGDEAMAIGGPDDAATHFEAALELLSRPGVSVPDGVDVPDVVTRSVEAIVACGQPGRAMALVSEHLEARGRAERAEESGDESAEESAQESADRGRLLLAWAGAALVNESTDAPVAETAEALRLVGDQPSPLRGRALSLHARALVNAGRHEEAAGYSAGALSMAQRFDDAEVAADAATTLATLDVHAGDFEAAVRALESVVAGAQAAMDTTTEMRGRYHLALVHLEHGLLAEAQDLFALAAGAAADAGRPWAPFGFDARYLAAQTAYLRGRWEEALALADATGQSPPADAEALLLSVRMLVQAGRGDPSPRALYEQLKPAWAREGVVALNSAAAVLDLAGFAGEVDRLWQVHGEVVGHLTQAWSPTFNAQVRLAGLVLGGLAGSAQQVPARDRLALLERAAALVEHVETVARGAASRPHGFGPEGVAWAARVRAERLRLRWGLGEPVDVPALVAAWREAVERFDVLGSPYEAARCRARLAAILTLVGDPHEAASLAEDARRTAEGLGAAPLLAELDEGTRRNARPAARRSEEGPSTALTPREEEILALVARGRTNGEIGRQLFISTKTVSVHVSNILGKLGAAGRTEAADLARRRGLLPD